MDDKDFQELKEEFRRFCSFTQGKIESVYNSEIFQRFKREYTGENLRKKIRAGRVKIVNTAKEAHAFLAPRYKLAKTKAISITNRFCSFTQEKVISARNSKLYKDFKQSAAKNWNKYGKPVVVGAGLTVIIAFTTLGIKKQKERINSPEYAKELCQKQSDYFKASVALVENFSDPAYLDPKIPTIGFGSTYIDGRKVTMNDTISNHITAEELAAAGGDMEEAAKRKAEKYVEDHAETNIYPVLTKVKDFRKLNENQQLALMVFVYNVGADAFANSSVLKDLNDGNLDKAAEDLLMYNKVTNKKGALVPAKGLILRETFTYYLFKGCIPKEDIINMDLSAPYHKELFGLAYPQCRLRDFTGKVPPLPRMDEVTLQKYLSALRSREGMTVGDCISNDCSTRIKGKNTKKTYSYKIKSQDWIK